MISEYDLKQLALINWAELEANGISKESIMKNPTVAHQLASRQVTDYVTMNRKGDLAFYGKVALKANYIPTEDGQGKLVVKAEGINPMMELRIYGEDIKSKAIREALTDSYSIPIEIDGRKEYRKQYSFVNGGTPIKLKDELYLISADPFKYNAFGDIYRGTNKLFIEKCSTILKTIQNNCKAIYNRPFTQAEMQALSEGKDLYREDFKKKNGETFDAVVQFDVVQNRVVVTSPSWYREKKKQLREAENMGKSEANVQSQGQSQQKVQVQTNSQEVSQTTNQRRGVRRG